MYELMMSMMTVFFFCLIFTFFYNGASFLNSLLYLESISLILFFSLFLCLYCYSSLKVLLFYLVFLVSESSLGLAILVKLMKNLGSDSMKSLHLSSC